MTKKELTKIIKEEISSIRNKGGKSYDKTLLAITNADSQGENFIQILKDFYEIDVPLKVFYKLCKIDPQLNEYILSEYGDD